MLEWSRVLLGFKTEQFILPVISVLSYNVNGMKAVVFFLMLASFKYKIKDMNSLFS